MRPTQFIVGFGSGLLLSVPAMLLAIYIASRTGWLAVSVTGSPGFSEAFDWLHINFGLSAVAFLLVFVAWAVNLGRLNTLLEAGADEQLVVQKDHLVDVLVAIFFGIGVIWTAIGLRSALISALAQPDMLTGADGVLRRLVDGGMLTALSTTIFGGIGGYLMRLYKTVSTGPAMRSYFYELSRHESDRLFRLLSDIHVELSNNTGRLRQSAVAGRNDGTSREAE